MLSPKLTAQSPMQMFWALNQNQYLLDVVPGLSKSFAYSVRKVRKGYVGFCMRVRRSVDNAEADVRFDAKGVLSANSNVTITATGTSGLSIGSSLNFSTFYSGKSVFVSIWYDQSGSGNNATQTSSTAQPLIVNAGTLIIENSIPSVEFSGSSSSINLNLATAISLTEGSLFAVYRATSPGITCAVAQNSSNSYNINTYNNTGKLGVTKYGVIDAVSTLSYNSTTLDLASWSSTAAATTSIEINNRTSLVTPSTYIPIAFSQIYGNALSGTTLRISEILTTAYTSTTQRASIFQNQANYFKTP
jgi:hypothetical protein